MKKIYLYMTAVAALTLTACSQDDSVFADSQSPSEANAVVFDTYLSNNSTRAGLEGVMSTTTLQQTGFGIVAMQGKLADLNDVPSTIAPNFMWNQYVGYEASNWVYSPLKYWPNETKDDKATGTATEMKGTPDNEGVSFYAYAPFVEEEASTTETINSVDYRKLKTSTSATAGIMSLTENTVKGDPKIHYVVAKGAEDKMYPSNSVDLLWGVSSGFAYHPVNQLNTEGTDVGTNAVIMPAGLPVEKMQKPGLEEKIKFDFKHALARIGMTVVGAFDQKAQGGTLDDATRVTIDEITVTSDAFAVEGILNLDNTSPNRALWEWGGIEDNKKFNVKVGSPAPTNNNQGQIKVTKATADEMNPELRFVKATKFPQVAGVKANEQYVLTENSLTKVTTPVFDWKKTYFTNDDKKNPTAVVLDDTSVKWTVPSGYNAYTKVGNDYKAITVWSIYDRNMVSLKKYETIPVDTKLNTLTAGPYYIEDGSYLKLVTNLEALDTDNDGKTEVVIYTLDISTTAPVAKFKDSVTDVYELTTKPLYFMVIPTTDSPTDKEVTVAIKYHVTTADGLMDPATVGDDKVVDTENYIEQVVTLKDFTNGKAYNLKLILGLTSVKVDAEVSNWEVGTVESNLPQNLE